MQIETSAKKSMRFALTFGLYIVSLFSKKLENMKAALSLHFKEFVGERASGFLFQNRRGNYLSQTNLLRRGLHPALKRLGQPKAGFHAFRRFRTTWLRKNRTPEDLIRFWLGHADETVTDGYSKLAEDVEYRKEVAAEVGLGFEISVQKLVVVPNVPNFAVFASQQSVA
jgi:integrase